MTTETESASIPEKVTLTFDPAKSVNPQIRTVFEDPLARTIWIAIRRSHLTNQYFNQSCLTLAKELRKKKYQNIDGKQLNTLLYRQGTIGSAEYDVGDKILPFVKGEKTFEIEYKLESKE